MKISMKIFTLSSLLTLSFAIQPTMAMHHEKSEHGHAMQHGHSMQSDKVKTMQNFANAEVKRVDLRQNKVTLKHSQILELDMPPMTMSFTAKESAMLEGLKRGDEVQFRADSKMNLLEIRR